MFFSFSGARMKVSVGEIKQLKFKEKGLFNQKEGMKLNGKLGDG